MALDVYREIPSVLISTALGLRPRAVLISTSGIFPVYRLKPCVNLYVYHIAMFMFTFCSLICNSFTFPSFFITCHPYIPFILLYWRAGASQPSRSTGTIFLYIIIIFISIRALSHAVMFYIFLNIRRTQFCITW